jgi:hypothetical protein
LGFDASSRGGAQQSSSAVASSGGAVVDEDSFDPTSLTFFDRFDEEFNTKAFDHFQAVDVNGDGLVDAEELKAGLESLGVLDAYLDPATVCFCHSLP